MEVTTRTKKKIKNTKTPSTGLKIDTITAKTENQKRFFKNYTKHQVISLTGSAGTGKTFLALSQSLKSIESGEYDKIIILRSSVSTRNIGFLPGTDKEKMAVYEAPYASLCTELYGRGDAYQILKSKGIISFDSTSFLRGLTYDKAIIIIDEAQNCSWGELYTILTRLGDNTKVIICGDTAQDDLTSERYKEESGLDLILKKLDLMQEYHYGVKFQPEDIVRSGFVKAFILLTQI